MLGSEKAAREVMRAVVLHSVEEIGYEETKKVIGRFNVAWNTMVNATKITDINQQTWPKVAVALIENLRHWREADVKSAEALI